jgi:peptide subunit release factor 1 (eRF1)
MRAEEKVALDCPYCGEAIYETLSWFKKAYSTCPACQKGLAAGQFAAVIDDIEQALDTEIEEMVKGGPESGCCGKKQSGCG